MSKVGEAIPEEEGVGCEDELIGLDLLSNIGDVIPDGAALAGDSISKFQSSLREVLNQVRMVDWFGGVH